MKPTCIAISLALGLLSVALTASGPVLGNDNDAESVQKISALRSEFNEAIKDHDAAGIKRFIDSEYQITTGSGRQYQATPETEAVDWAEIFRTSPDVIYVRTPDTIEVSSYNDLAAENGTWVGRWTAPGGELEMGGSYFAQWRKLDGDWKIRAEVFVTLYCKGPGCSD